VATSEFLPHAEAFVEAGGQHIYVATDSGAVIDEIRSKWPSNISKRVRQMENDDVTRSRNDTAVFDMVGSSHHRTNVEALVEILALSKCQFLIHGLSALSESSIWINIGLHNRSVNLEDGGEEHMSAPSFQTMVQMALGGEPQSRWPHPIRTDTWWIRDPVPAQSFVSIDSSVCNKYNGILHIGAVGSESGTAAAFFIDVLNQLLYADKYDLLPWIHLTRATSELVFDDEAHGHYNLTEYLASSGALSVSLEQDPRNAELLFPGKPVSSNTQGVVPSRYSFEGTGVWTSYFSGHVPDFQNDPSCKYKPVISLERSLVTPGLDSYCPWSVRAWRYDAVPDHLWNYEPEGGGDSLKSLYEPMRRKAHEIVSKYYRFRPYIMKRVAEVNPVADGDKPCLGVHFRIGVDKKGKFRKKIPADKYQSYIEAFVRAGGETIYVASDSHRPLLYMEKNFPPAVTKTFRSQGKYVVRATKGDYPAHYLDGHHRINSETLVDILALSKCRLLLHTYSTVAEAAIYLNFAHLHNNSVNLEDPGRLTSDQFYDLAREVLLS